MLQNIFKNMQPVVKNLLIINALFFLATFIFEHKGIDLVDLLGLKYFDSPDFSSYQIITSFFMHGGFGHVFFNMFALVVFGNMLEKEWGSKRFLIFYFITALGATLLYVGIQAFESYQYVGTITPFSDGFVELKGNSLVYLKGPIANFHPLADAIYSNLVGASGAVYGLLMGVAMLFPNITVYLYAAIPIKMKWLALGLGLIAIVSAVQDNEAIDGSSVAHFAHLGGMLFGFIMVKIWKKEKNNFY